jgi:hypothetical protein
LAKPRDAFDLPFRQIHLDFHTSEHIPDVGRDFDARAFARQMKRARVNSVTVFAKCHHGLLYYNTARPERHPGLKKGLDLLGQQIDALHREGIRAPIYLSVQCDEYAANAHPEWVAREADSSQVKWAGGRPDKVFGAGWQILDLSTPYQEYLAEQTAEVLKRFKPVDGIFFDMCWDQTSTTREAIAGMAPHNLNPELDADRLRYANLVAQAYMKRFHAMVKASSRDATVFFNGRQFHQVAQDLPHQTQLEIEALPTGGWGYTYFPKNVRYVRTFGRPYLGMTARFHKSWADFGGLKPYAALEYETAQMIAHGARCSIGDQLHPRGTLDRGAYDLIERVYSRIEAAEPYVRGAQNVAQIGLFQLPPTASRTTQSSTSGTDEGAVRMLTQLKHQFDVVSAASELERYDLLVLPDAIDVDPGLARRLRAYLRTGGKLLCTGTSGLSPDGTESRLPELRVKPAGLFPFTTTYVRFGDDLAFDVPDSDHVVYNRGVRVTPGKGGQALAKVVEPYFERAWNHFSSHFQTPPDKTSRYAAVVATDNTAYVAYPLFAAFANHGNYPYRLLVRNLLNRLIDPLVQVQAPTSTEVTVQQRGTRTVLHLLHYSPERRTAQLDLIEDVVPLFDVPVSLKREKPPGKVSLAPGNQEIPFTHAGGRTSFLVPEVRGHQMVVLE